MAATKTRTITAEVRDALSSIEWDGPRARLTCGQLDRKVYVAVNDALETLGGKWSRKDKAHVFDEAAHDELEAAIETGSYTSAADLKQVYQEFETPDALADKAAALLHLGDEPQMILEPSAGSGQLIKALRRQPRGEGDTIYAVEIQEKQRDRLSCVADVVHVGDFLESHGIDFGDDEPFDAIVMNPPFARQADIDHVQHAWRFLKPGGRLVAIMSPGWTFRTNAKSVVFTEFVANHGTWHKNPEGSFKQSGTGVNTVTVVLNK